MWPFSKKIKAKPFFNHKTSKLDIGAITASVPNKYMPVDLSLGSLKTEKFATNVSERLVELDLIQIQLANTINGMNEGATKETKKSEYFDTLIKMLKSTKNTEEAMSRISQGDEEDKKEYDLYGFYSNSNYEIANIPKGELNNPGLIIWPVTLQDRPTIIHKAQVEVIKILQRNRWQLKILIADCGTTNNVEKKILTFKNELEKHLKKRNIVCESISLLSEYYKPDSNGGDILKKFTEISSNLKISELKEFNTKQETYSKENKLKVEQRFTLKFIQPVLSWSVVIHEAENYSNKNQGKKTIIIAGKDELKQWKYIFSFSSNIGGLFNIILKDEGKNTIFQEEKPMIFHSEQEVYETLEKGNLAKWLFESFIATPNFPNELSNLPFCNKCERKSNCRDCLFPNNNSKLPEFVDRKKFVDSFWNIITPA